MPNKTSRTPSKYGTLAEPNISRASTLKAVMDQAFDPYYKWLGIPPQDQPADHYRLLGITQFESDPQVIESAADRQMVHLRTLANGPHGPLSQKLLNEVAAARITLLNTDKKEAYDHQLLARQPRRAAALPVAAVLEVSEGPAVQTATAGSFREIPHVEVPIVTTAAPRKIAPRRRSAWQIPALISGLVTVVILIAALIFALKNQGQQPVSKGPQPLRPSRKPEKFVPDGITPKPSVAVNTVPQQPVHPDGGSTDQPTGQHTQGDLDSNLATTTNGSPVGRSPGGSGPGGSGPGGSGLGGGGVSNTRVSDDRPIEFMPGRRVDLLTRISPLRHAIDGPWTWTSEGLYAPAGRSRLRVPFRPDERPYQLRIHARRESGNGPMIVALVHKDREFLAVFDNNGRTYLSQVDGQRELSEASWGESIFQGKEFAEILIIVRSDRLTLIANNKPLGTWTDYNRLSPDPTWNDNQGLPLVGWNLAAFTISKFELTPLPTSPASANAQGPANFAGAGRAPLELAGQQSGSKKKPAPDEAARRKAEENFKKTFAGDLQRADKPAGKTALARDLAGRARSAQGNPAEHYVLLSQALQLAVDGGEVPLTLQILDTLAQEFAIDSAKLRTETMSQLGRSATTMEARQTLVTACLEQADAAAKEEAYDDAAGLCGVAATTALALKDVELRKTIKERQDEFKMRQKQWEAASRARDTLKQSPDDEAANLILGKYLCLVRGDWDTGLKHLVKSSDSKLRELAQRELAKPATPTARAETGDGWFAIAEGSKTDKPAYLSRAKQWYEQAVSGLTALERTRVDKRVGEINEQLYRLSGGKGRAAFPFTGLIGRVKVANKDVDLVIHYQPGKKISAQAIRDLLAKHNIKPGAIQIELAGMLTLPVDTNTQIYVDGHSSMVNQLSITGAEEHMVDGSGRNGRHTRLELLRTGTYYIRWVLAGQTIEDCGMGMDNYQNQPLPIFHTPQMVTSLRPQRAKAEVDVTAN